MILGAVFALAACGKKNALPKTDYEKVAFAFNGVEKSFQNVGKKSAGDAEFFTVPRLLAGEGDPLSTIRGLYTAGDNQGDVIDDLEYTQPPMIQFQCLKAVLEKIGKKFEFGTKYYDDFTGTVYVDPTTGAKKKDAQDKDDYKYDYSFRLALRIDIDGDDSIAADVSFSIRLTRDNKDISTEWYVHMDLDYDMTSKTPIYALAMWTANDERELAYRGDYTYEYDYVDMRADGINEWRKFVLEPGVKLEKDEAHPTFESYRNAGVAFRADTCKWYYDSALRKVTQSNAEKEARIADAFFAFGLNSTDVGGQEFLSANGTKSDAITDAYKKFSEIFKMDVIYSLVTKNENDNRGGNGGHGDIVGIRVLTAEGSAWSTQTIERDCTVSDLLTGYGPWGQGVGVARPCIWTVDAAGDKVDMLSNFSDYNYTITLGKGIPLPVALDTRLSTVLANDLGGRAALERNGFYITIGITDKNNPAYKTSFGAIVGFASEIDQQTAKQFPAELTAFGVPTYETQNGSFELGDYKEGNAMVTLRINGSNNDERAVYLAKLTNEGFIPDNDGAYVKIVDKNVVKIRVPGFDLQTLTITASKQANGNPSYTTIFPADAVASWVDGKFTIPTPTKGRNFLFCYNSEGKYIYIYGMTETEVVNMLLTIGNQTDTQINNETHTITSYRDGYYYTIEYALESNNVLYLMLDIGRFGAQDSPISISVNEGAAQPFWPNGGSGATLTVTLAENDTFTFTPPAGMLEGGDQYFYNCLNFNDWTQYYTVITAGTYTFTGDPGMIQVIRN